MVIVQKHSAFSAATSNTGPNVGFLSNLTGGNAVSGYAGWFGALTDISSITDGTNTYTIQSKIADANGYCIAQFYLLNVAGGALQPHATFSVSTPGQFMIGAYEVSGLTAFDAAANAGSNGIVNNAAAIILPNTGSTTAANDFVVAWCSSTSSATIQAAANGYTAETNNNGSIQDTTDGNAITLLSQTQASIGAIIGTSTPGIATQGSGANDTVASGAMAFKVSAADTLMGQAIL